MRSLSARELKFATAYIETGGDVCKAAIAAGYSAKGAASEGNRVLRRERVQSRLREFREEMESKHSYSRDRMLSELEAVIKSAGEGDYPNYAAVLKAKEMQCKMLGYFEPETQTVSNYDVSISVLEKTAPAQSSAEIGGE